MFAVSDVVRNPEISFMLEIDGQQKTVLTLNVHDGKFNVEVPENVSMTQAAIHFLTVLNEVYPGWIAERNSEVTTKDPHDPWYVGGGMPAEGFFLDPEDTVEVIQPTVKISDLPSLSDQDEVFYVRYNPYTDSLTKVPLKNRQLTAEINLDLSYGYEVEIDPNCTIEIGTVHDDLNYFKSKNTEQAKECAEILEDAVEVYHEIRLTSITEHFDEPMKDSVMTSGMYLRPESAERLDTRMSRIQPAEVKQEVSWSSGSYEKE